MRRATSSVPSRGGDPNSEVSAESEPRIMADSVNPSRLAKNSVRSLGTMTASNSGCTQTGATARPTHCLGTLRQTLSIQSTRSVVGGTLLIAARYGLWCQECISTTSGANVRRRSTSSSVGVTPSQSSCSAYSAIAGAS